MHRFFLNPEHISGQQVVFPSDLAHQITHVLRLDEGDQVGVLENNGFIHRVRLQVGGADGSVTGIIMDTNPVLSEPKTHISLYFGLTSREKVEWIMQKGTEIGVSAFYPFFSTRTLVKPGSLSSKKIERWNRIIREAAEQSGRGRLPVLSPPKDLAKCLLKSHQDHQLCLLAWEDASSGGETIGRLLEDFTVGSVALFVGPEGGFTSEEVTMAIESGCQVVSLGARVLRMETAAIIFPALVLFERREL